MARLFARWFGSVRDGAYVRALDRRDLRPVGDLRFHRALQLAVRSRALVQPRHLAARLVGSRRGIRRVGRRRRDQRDGLILRPAAGVLATRTKDRADAHREPLTVGHRDLVRDRRRRPRRRRHARVRLSRRGAHAPAPHVVAATGRARRRWYRPARSRERSRGLIPVRARRTRAGRAGTRSHRDARAVRGVRRVVRDRRPRGETAVGRSACRVAGTVIAGGRLLHDRVSRRPRRRARRRGAIARSAARARRCACASASPRRAPAANACSCWNGPTRR